MPKMIAYSVLAMVIACASGCGAMSELMMGPDPPDYYCALKGDFETGKESFSEGSVRGFGIGLMCLVDSVPSAVIDTLLLPGVYLGRLTYDAFIRHEIKSDDIDHSDSVK
jgi:uncharacterized protein YceK